VDGAHATGEDVHHARRGNCQSALESPTETTVRVERGTATLGAAQVGVDRADVGRDGVGSRGTELVEGDREAGVDDDLAVASGGLFALEIGCISQLTDVARTTTATS